MYFFFKLGAVGLLENLERYRILVRMRDDSYFDGEIENGERIGTFYPLPFWMEPGFRSQAGGYYFFMRTEKGTHFQGSLKYSGRPRRHTPYPRGPANVEIRLGDAEYYTAEGFKLYNPTHKHTFDKPYLPPSNRIFLVMKEGPAYSAMLVKYIRPLPLFRETTQTRQL